MVAHSYEHSPAPWENKNLGQILQEPEAFWPDSYPDKAVHQELQQGVVTSP
jgi:hypothetical protein